jgi:hypothetical protein
VLIAGVETRPTLTMPVSGADPAYDSRVDTPGSKYTFLFRKRFRACIRRHQFGRFDLFGHSDMGIPM